MSKQNIFRAIATIVLSTAFIGVSSAERNVYFTGDFETGQIEARESTHDGFFMHTLPERQSGSTSVSSGKGGFGPSDSVDTKVVRSERVGSEEVKPRAGEYFLRAALYRDKDYTELNGGIRKPRTKFYPNYYPIDFDVEGFTGFSVYIPKNFQVENRRTNLLSIVTKASATLMAIEVSSPEVGKSRWGLLYNTSDSSITESKSFSHWVDLGAVSADYGKWTDFVIRYRWNPFSVRTNASRIPGGKDQFYDGNKGILQVWKATGAADEYGDRPMKLVVNLENEPVGLVPRSDLKIKHNFQVYKPMWQRADSSVNNVWFGFDEIRMGTVPGNHVSFADVSPSGRICSTSDCPTVAADEPNPPTHLQVVAQ